MGWWNRSKEPKVKDTKVKKVKVKEVKAKKLKHVKGSEYGPDKMIPGFKYLRILGKRYARISKRLEKANKLLSEQDISGMRGNTNKAIKDLKVFEVELIKLGEGTVRDNKGNLQPMHKSLLKRARILVRQSIARLMKLNSTKLTDIGDSLIVVEKRVGGAMRSIIRNSNMSLSEGAQDKNDVLKVKNFVKVYRRVRRKYALSEEDKKKYKD